MKYKKLLSFILMVVFAVSQLGCTSYLWDHTDPHVWIDGKDITEAELQARGVSYKRYTTEKMNGYAVGKSDREKLKDYAYRALGTPVTLVADAAATASVGVVVVGVLFIQSGGWESLNGICN